MSNDLFAEATPITLTAGEYTSDPVSNVALGLEPNEPGGGARSAWWVFTPTSDQALSLDTAQSTMPGDLADTLLSVYTGTALDQLTLLASNDDVPGGDVYTSLIPSLTFTAGTTYYIRVAAYSPADMTYVLHLGPQIIEPLVLPALRLLALTNIDPDPEPVVPLDIPPIGAEATIPAPSIGGDNDRFNFAADIVKGNERADITISNVGYTTQAGEPGGGYRSAWWSYTPTESGTATIYFFQPYTGERITGVYTGTDVTALTPIVEGTSEATFTATAGTTYRIRLAYASDTDADYYLMVEGPPSIVDHGPIVVPAVQMGVLLHASGPFGAGRFVVDTPISVQVGLPGVAVNSVKLTLLDPDPALFSPVPVARPAFTVLVSPVETGATAGTVEIQYDVQNNPDYDQAVTMTADVDLTAGTRSVTVTSPVDLHAEGIYPTYYQWRARLITDGIASAWTPSGGFFYALDAGTARLRIGWTVTDDEPDPHLWFAAPGRGVPGATVTVVGQGFTTTQGQITIAGALAEITGWTLVAANGTATTTARSITAGDVDCEHFEARIVVPDVSAPGGQLIVEGAA